MQKIFNSNQIKRCDEFTIANEPIASIDLMERAAKAVFQFLIDTVEADIFEIYCGQGNNGGDGLALARMLLHAQKKVAIYVISVKEKGTEDFEVNLQKLKLIYDAKIVTLASSSDFVIPHQKAVIIDALIGTGAKGAADGLIKETIDFINYQSNDKIAIDVPSGLLCDEPLLQNSVVVNASATLSFQFMKLAYLFPENNKYIGKIKLLDIGLSRHFIESENTKHFFIDHASIHEIIPARKLFAHKGNFGHAMLLVGSAGKYGAALLAAKGCLRSGAGLLTVHSASNLEHALNVYLPSAMFNADPQQDKISEIPELSKYNVIAAGCGIGDAPETVKALKVLIQQCKSSLVLDADALNILAENKTWLTFLPPGTILTPHPKEFERLAGKWSNGFERLQMQKDFSVKYNCYVVFKGAYTCVSSPIGNCYFNSTGNAGMAKGGSGDVLTGIITGLLAQGLNHAEACIAAVYFHGVAGDLAKQKQGEISMLPEDLIEQLGNAFTKISNN